MSAIVYINRRGVFEEVDRAQLVIPKGSTYVASLFWGLRQLQYIAITGQPSKVPLRFTCQSHGLISRVPVNVLGHPTLSKSRSYAVRVIDADTVEINSLANPTYPDFATGWYLSAATPIDLAGKTGSLQVRAKAADADPLISLTTENGGLVFDDTDKRIDLVFAETDLDAVSVNSGVWFLEVTDGGVAKRVVAGKVRFLAESEAAVSAS